MVLLSNGIVFLYLACYVIKPMVSEKNFLSSISTLCLFSPQDPSQGLVASIFSMYADIFIYISLFLILTGFSFVLSRNLISRTYIEKLKKTVILMYKISFIHIGKYYRVYAIIAHLISIFTFAFILDYLSVYAAETTEEKAKEKGGYGYPIYCVKIVPAEALDDIDFSKPKPLFVTGEMPEWEYKLYQKSKEVEPSADGNDTCEDAAYHMTEQKEKALKEQERIEQERIEQERIEQERIEQERIEQERIQQERIQQERIEQERIQQERIQQERIQQERIQQERIQQERFRTEDDILANLRGLKLKEIQLKNLLTSPWIINDVDTNIAREATPAEAAKIQAQFEQAETARQAEMARQAETARQAEMARQAETARQAEMARQVDMVQQVDIVQQADTHLEDLLDRVLQQCAIINIADNDVETLKSTTLKVLQNDPDRPKWILTTESQLKNNDTYAAHIVQRCQEYAFNNIGSGDPQQVLLARCIGHIGTCLTLINAANVLGLDPKLFLNQEMYHDTYLKIVYSTQKTPFGI